MHGANRLASNSLLEGLVFAHRAVESSVAHHEYATKMAATVSCESTFCSHFCVHSADDAALQSDHLRNASYDRSPALQGLQHAASHADFTGTKSARLLPDPAASWVASKRQHLTELIWSAAGIVRSTAGLKAALLQLASLYVEVRALGQARSCSILCPASRCRPHVHSIGISFVGKALAGFV